MSMFAISLEKSGVQLLMPRALDLSPCIFQDDIVSDLYSIVHIVRFHGFCSGPMRRNPSSLSGRRVVGVDVCWGWGSLRSLPVSRSVGEWVVVGLVRE